MRRPDPPDLDTYTTLFNEYTRIEGYWLDMHQIMPCSFCCEPGVFTLYPVAGIAPGDTKPSIDQQLEEGFTCPNCGRSAKGIVKRSGSGVTVEFVQTGGDDPPAYLPPIRRLP